MQVGDYGQVFHWEEEESVHGWGDGGRNSHAFVFLGSSRTSETCFQVTLGGGDDPKPAADLAAQLSSVPPSTSCIHVTITSDLQLDSALSFSTETDAWGLGQNIVVRLDESRYCFFFFFLPGTWTLGAILQ